MNETFKKALAEAGRRLGACKIAYAATGSSNLILHGIDSDPVSVTLVVSEKDLGNIKDAFFEYKVSSVKKSEEKKFVSFWLDGVSVEVFSDKLYASVLQKGQVEKVDLLDEVIVGLTLEAQKECFENLGDEENVKLVEEYVE